MVAGPEAFRMDQYCILKIAKFIHNRPDPMKSRGRSCCQCLPYFVLPALVSATHFLHITCSQKLTGRASSIPVYF